ncbi:MAG TPA: hydrolase [Planctomycetota bacterium]|nr:hydrolase [Planctomycetota bacterium]
MHWRTVPSACVLFGLSSFGVGVVAGREAGTGVVQDERKPAPLWAEGGRRERFTPENCVIALIDHQTGLMNLVDNAPPTTFKNVVVALAKTAKIHGVPTVITTSAETGPNGPFVPEVLKILPNAPVISRPGQINAWENADFVDALRKTGRRKIVMAGITTDVCVAFAALSALDAGFDVYVVADASGATNADVQQAALMRMSAAGAVIGTWFGISCELLYDWRNPTGPATAQLFVEHMPSYAEIFHSHQARSAAAGAATDERPAGERGR